MQYLPPCDIGALPLAMILGLVVGACIVLMFVGIENEIRAKKRLNESYQRVEEFYSAPDDPNWDYDPSQPQGEQANE